MTFVLVIHGAIKNFGDFLIFERAKNLLKTLIPNRPIISIRRDIPMHLQLSKDIVQNSCCIVIAGGPGLNRNIHKLYDFTAIMNLNKPVYVLGWGTYNHKQHLSTSDIIILRYITSFGPIGVRDILTKELLDTYNISNQLNGCPAWYSNKLINNKKIFINIPRQINYIGLSVPANPLLSEVFVELVKQIKKLSKNIEPIVLFNRGIADKNLIPKVQQSANLHIVKQLTKEQIKYIDISGGTYNTDAIDKIDLHIGFRVHMHIYFLSIGKPSILIPEDDRGIGMGKTLSPSVTLEKPNLYSPTNTWDKLQRRILFEAPSIGQVLLSSLQKEIACNNKNWITDSIHQIDNIIHSKSYLSEATFFSLKKIEQTFHNNMKPFILKNIARVIT